MFCKVCKPNEPSSPLEHDSRLTVLVALCLLLPCAASDQNYCVTSHHLAKLMAMTVSSTFAGTLTGTNWQGLGTISACSRCLPLSLPPAVAAIHVVVSVSDSLRNDCLLLFRAYLLHRQVQRLPVVAPQQSAHQALMRAVAATCKHTSTLCAAFVRLCVQALHMRLCWQPAWCVAAWRAPLRWLALQWLLSVVCCMC
jgi:hypothetical protein